ncbi:choice-of-anchor Q domain-containing protein [Parabacteroides sp. PF5-6]|uniref:choice-of-anchor Q domain-containing protein n=1 Tax=Parabacteroides sp. PF5-6 TaxID=1742403 RepID=UPI00240618E6|nr:choice-of-anchor Q domain-containing protein [Parabacteroides sp. PF5-6]MDF9831495.1 hypothetical protein [Parabacteroides sp. PF5-6]
MKRTKHLILTLCLIGLALSLNAFAAGAETKVIRVNAAATGGDGSSWDNAYKELSDALAEAKTLAEAAAADADPVEIWVAQGTYYPKYKVGIDTDDRDRAFVIPAGVEVYGGFAGGEENLSDRGWATNPTILSGEIGENGIDDNCFRVVYLTGGTLDGFHITGGYGQSGGGVCATDGTLKNNRIYGNTAGFGGGVYAINATLINNTIYGNTANQGGGVDARVTTTLTGNTIYGNTGIYGAGGVITFENTTLTNNILWGNKYGESGSAQDLYVTGTSTTGSNNLIGSMVKGDGASYNDTDDLIGDPYFIDPANGDFRLGVYSAAIGAGTGDANIGAWPAVTLVSTNNILYVSRTVDITVADYQGDGSSWTNAISDLGEALAFAADPDNKVAQIWVAQGTYYPKYKAGNGTDDRDCAFVIPAGVEVYGGFAGGETERDQRDWVKNRTTLSGDIGDLNDNTDNCYHVVVMVLKRADVDTGADAETATLDGFHITGGNASGGNSITVDGVPYIYRYYGGGVFASGEALITNNTIYGNEAESYGGGVYANDATLINNTICDNTAKRHGGGVFADGATLTHNRIYGNKATTTGGGVNANVGTTLTGNTIYGNEAGHGGGGGVFAAGATLINNTIYGNTAANSGGGVLAYTSTILTNNILWGNKLEDGSGKDLYVSSASGSHNLIGSMAPQKPFFIEANPLIGEDIDPLFVDAANGDFRLQEGSPAIDAGDNEAYEDKDYPDTDAAGDERIQNNIINIGAYETVVLADPAEYHTLTLEVAPGILLHGLSAGEHLVSDHLFLQFLPEDPALTAEDIMLVIDGVDTPFTVPAAGAYYSYILNPVTADHTILIAQRAYDVILTPTEGVTYSVGAGTHSVAYGEAFSFAVTLDDAIDPEAVHVYANGQEIGPSNSPSNLPQGEALRSEATSFSSPLGGGREGASLSYTIDAVTGPVTVTLEGYTTGHASLATGKIRLVIDNGQLTIDNEMTTAVDVAVYTVTGQTFVQLRGLRGSKTIALPAGIYFVRAGQQTWKVMVND